MTYDDAAGERALGSVHTRAAGFDAMTSSVLTPRQREALHWRALGLTMAETGDKLGISAGGTQNTLHAAYRRLGVGCLVDALRAVGWLKVPE